MHMQELPWYVTQLTMYFFVFLLYCVRFDVISTLKKALFMLVVDTKST